MKIDKSLLIVDDIESIRHSMQRIFKRVFRDCYVAEDGIDALKVCESKEVDLIMSDIVMPRMNGVELIKEVKKNFPSIQPIIVMTGESSSEQLSELERMNVKCFNKPIDVDEIEQYILENFQ